MSNQGLIFKKMVSECIDSVPELARRLGLTQVYIYKLYKKENINYKYLYEIKKQYDIDVRKYFTDLPYLVEELEKIKEQLVPLEEYKALKEENKKMVSLEKYENLKLELEQIKTKYIYLLEAQISQQQK